MGNMEDKEEEEIGCDIIEEMGSDFTFWENVWLTVLAVVVVIGIVICYVPVKVCEWAKETYEEIRLWALEDPGMD